MTFQEAFDKIRSQIISSNVSNIKDKIAAQVNLTGDGAGTFYIEVKDGYLSVEPYDYHDRDLMFTADTYDFIDIVFGKLSAEKAVMTHRLSIDGNLALAGKINNFMKRNAE